MWAGAALARADLVVNCTPIGLRGSGSENDAPFDVAVLPAHATVVDLIANPAESALVRAAKTASRTALVLAWATKARPWMMLMTCLSKPVNPSGGTPRI